MYSGTYLSVIVIVLAQVLPLLGVDVGSEALTTTLQTIITIVSGVVILYKRWIGNQEPVTLLGFKK